jgi:hypothetical protein
MRRPPASVAAGSRFQKGAANADTLDSCATVLPYTRPTGSCSTDESEGLQMATDLEPAAPSGCTHRCAAIDRYAYPTPSVTRLTASAMRR